jgi:ornithine cyclodeaminase
MSGMQHFDAAFVRARLNTAALLDALQSLFQHGCTAPIRHAHTLPVPNAVDASLLLMPAWQSGRYLGTKLVTVFPGNSARNQPAVASIYILFDALTGAPLALMDGDTLTERRTAATSALAARFLAREDAQSMLVVGSGLIARELALTHWDARPSLREVRIWSRTPERARALVAELHNSGLPAALAPSLADAARSADLISVATLATEPLLKRDWIQLGAHIDLVGAFRPGMREAEDALVAASRVVCDTRAGVLAEADDVRVPLAHGLLEDSAILELADLCRGTPGRLDPTDITLFKSVGAALEDLAAAILVYETHD